MLALVVVLRILGSRRVSRLPYAMAAGALGGAAAIGLFLPVGLVTGNAACVHAASGLPLAVYHAPVALALSMATVPLGRLLGQHAAAWADAPAASALRPRLVLDLLSLLALVGLVFAQLALT
jgi:hypothetical protein